MSDSLGLFGEREYILFWSFEPVSLGEGDVAYVPVNPNKGGMMSVPVSLGEGDVAFLNISVNKRGVAYMPVRTVKEVWPMSLSVTIKEV